MVASIPATASIAPISGDYQCAAGEKVVGFTKIDANSIRDGITLTD